MGESTPSRSGLTRICQVVQRLGRRAFRASDARARGRGWEVTETGSWSRSYRDPRFDRFAVCGACAGGGCGACGGTGRVDRSTTRSAR